MARKTLVALGAVVLAAVLLRLFVPASFYTGTALVLLVALVWLAVSRIRALRRAERGPDPQKRGRG